MEKYDVIVIGAGPGGLTSAMYASRANLKTLVIDKGLYGGQMNNTAGIENYTGFSNVLGAKLGKLMFKSATRFGAQYMMGNVKRISVDGNARIVRTDVGNYEAPVVIIATGAKQKELGILGEKEYAGQGVSYCAVCDANFFKDKPVIVVGGGDSAFTEAEYLSHIVSKVTIVVRKSKPQAEPEEVTKAEKNPKINILYNQEVKRIYGDKQNKKGVQGVVLYNNKTETKNNFKTSAVFIYIGTLPVSSMFRNLSIVDKYGWIKSGVHMETSVPGIYAVGDIREGQLRQVVTAVGDGGIAGHQAYEYISNLKYIKNIEKKINKK